MEEGGDAGVVCVEKFMKKENITKKSISKFDSILDLDYLCFERESQYLERKGYGEEDIKPTKIANEIIGMLNSGGGVLVFGISNEGLIQDLKSIDSNLLDQYRKLVHDFIKPSANIILEETTLETGELIFIYHVSPDHERVFCRSDNENIYIRIYDSNKGPLNRDQVRKLEYDKEIRKFEEELRSDFNMQDIDMDILDQYKNKINFLGSSEELLIARNLAKRNERNEIVCKNSAILLFAKDPDSYISNAFVRYVRYDGKDRKVGEDFNVIKDESFRASIPKTIEVLKKFIYASLRDYYYLDIESGKFLKISEYPQEAWLEGIVNSLCHRSYNIKGNCVYIKHFDDRFEISNSGPLPSQVTIENIRTERYSRNPRIARVLFEMGYVRELNEGVPRIYESMKKSMLENPEYSVVSDTVKLLLKNNVAEHELSISENTINKIEREWKNYNDNQRKIITSLFKNQHSTLSQFQDLLSISDQAIRVHLNYFLSENLIERNSAKIRDKDAIYTLKKT